LRRCGHVAVAALALLSMSCSFVDAFGPRVDTYNKTALESKKRLLFDNIIRAAFQEPLQWSAISQIQGTASVTATLAGKVPIIGHKGTSSLFYEIDPSVGASGGPTFTVPLLDTKEFQAGIQAPISLMTLKTYIDQGYPLNILLPLLISGIEVGSDKNNTVTIENFDIDRPIGNADQKESLIRTFNGSIRILINNGLTIERFERPIGPLMLPKDLSSPKTLTDAIAAGLEVRQYELSDGSVDPFLSPVESKYLAAQKTAIYFRSFQINQYRFCFDSHRRFHEAHLTDNVLEGSRYTGTPFPLLVKKAKDSDGNGPDKFEDDTRTELRITEKLVCGHPGPTDGNSEVLNFTLRSVEGAVRFLGAVTRIEIGENGDAPRRGPQIALTESGRQNATFFQIYKGSLWGESVSVSRDGNTYSMSLDDDPRDLSGKVLSLLLELVNLNNSVKDQPTPNVISVIAP